MRSLSPHKSPQSYHILDLLIVTIDLLEFAAQTKSLGQDTIKHPSRSEELLTYVENDPEGPGWQTMSPHIL